MLAAAIGIVATVCWGALTDRVGRRPVYLLGTAITLLWGVPLFLTVNTGARLAIIIAFIISYAVCQNSLAGVQGAWFSELFSANTRTSGASLAYQLSAVVSGFTPLIATALVQPDRLDRTRLAVQLLRPAWPHRHPGDERDLGTGRAGGGGAPRTRDHARAGDGSEHRSGRCVVGAPDGSRNDQVSEEGSKS